MLGLKNKTKPADPAPDLSRWDTARNRWADAEAKMAGLQAERDGIKMAISLARNPHDADRVSDRLKLCAAPYSELAENRPDRLLKQLSELDEKIKNFAAEVQAEREMFEISRRQETTRRAVDLQPQHRQAVEKIAAGLELLSEGVAAERHVRAQVGPLPTSNFLPDVSTELSFDLLDAPNGRTAAWFSKIEKLGIIKRK